MSKKLGLALGSGGSRGVAHVGVLRALEEEGIRPDYISGCSMGAVVGACYANGMTTEKMMSVVLKLKTIDLVDVSAMPISRSGFLKGKKMQNLLVRNLGDVTFDQLKIPFTCVASDVYSGRLHQFSEGNVALAVQASSAIPTFFRPVQFEDKLLVDGGVLCRVPVKQVKDMGADVVIGVDALTNTGEPIEKKVPNMVSMVLRVYDMMDFNQFTMESHLESGICDLWLQPEIEGMSQYVIKELDRAFDVGYDYAKKNMQKIKELLA